MRRSLLLAGIAAASLVASVVVADAQQRMVRVGVLECRGGASVGFIVGSVTNLGCVLRAEGLPEDRYVATIRKVGLDIGITQETARWPGACSRRSTGSDRATSRALMRVRRVVPRSASVSAATCWSAAPTIRSRSSPSACRARSASTSRPGLRAWNFAPAVKSWPSIT
ncbi:hypothetical protein ACVWZZ_002823 [Bradyrhizobium sp. LM6.10]